MKERIESLLLASIKDAEKSLTFRGILPYRIQFIIDTLGVFYEFPEERVKRLVETASDFSKAINDGDSLLSEDLKSLMIYEFENIASDISDAINIR